MAVTVTAVLAGTDTYIADIEATADADTTATITHGLGATPLEVSKCELAVAATLSLWRATTINSTTVVMTKSTTASSGAAGNQVRVTIKRPHTIGR